jgi:glucoamylase
MASLVIGALCVLGLTSTASAQIPIVAVEPRATGSLDSFLATETPIALQGILNNIGANGADVAGASAGMVVASPSKQDPNCKKTPNPNKNLRHSNLT